MKGSLCVLLVFSPCSVVAQDASLEFRKVSLREAPFSLFEGVPGAGSSPFLGISQAGRAPRIGIFTSEIPFPMQVGSTERQADTVGDVRAALRDAFHFDAVAHVSAEEKADLNEGPITTLQPFHVFGHSEREIVEAIEAARAARDAEDFNPLTGGRLGLLSFGSHELEIGVWKPKSVIPFPRILTPPEVELLRLKW
jgi:hypothetical protein